MTIGAPMECRVVFADEKVKKSFDKLNNTKTEDRELYERLNQAFDAVSENAFCGIQIPKKLIPKEYIKKYQIDNLWKLNLSKSWRLLYSIARDEIIIIAIILEWLPHKEYEKRFKY